MSSKSVHISIRLAHSERAALDALKEAKREAGEDPDVSKMFREALAEECERFGIQYPVELLTQRPQADHTVRFKVKNREDEG